MRFLADMGIAISVVEWLRDQGHDARFAGCRTDFRAGSGRCRRRSALSHPAPTYRDVKHKRLQAVSGHSASPQAPNMRQDRAALQAPGIPGSNPLTSRSSWLDRLLAQLACSICSSSRLGLSCSRDHCNPGQNCGLNKLPNYARPESRQMLFSRR